MSPWRGGLLASTLVFVALHANCRAIGTRDTKVMELTALSLATTFDISLTEFPEAEYLVSSGAVQRHEGRLLPAYPLVPSIAAAPVFAVAAATMPFGATSPAPLREAIGKLAGSLLAASACGLMYAIIRRRFPRAPALGVTVAAALATPYWSIAGQSLNSHAAAACFLAGALALAPGSGASRPAALAAGALAGLAVACRILLSPFAAGLLVIAWKGDNLRWTAAGMLGVLAAMAAWHLQAFGHVLGGAGYLEAGAVHAETHLVSSALSPDFLGSFGGVLFSPSRGLLVYMPIAACAIAGGLRLWRHDRPARWLFIVPTLVYVVCWSAYSVWWAGHSYGPRYASDIVVPLTLMVTALFYGRPQPRPIVRAFGVAALAWSIGVQAIGVFSYPNGQWDTTPADVDKAHARLWDWRDNQIFRTASAGMYTKHLDRFSSFFAPDRGKARGEGVPLDRK